MEVRKVDFSTPSWRFSRSPMLPSDSGAKIGPRNGPNSKMRFSRKKSQKNPFAEMKNDRIWSKNQYFGYRNRHFGRKKFVKKFFIHKALQISRMSKIMKIGPKFELLEPKYGFFMFLKCAKNRLKKTTCFFTSTKTFFWLFFRENPIFELAPFLGVKTPGEYDRSIDDLKKGREWVEKVIFPRPSIFFTVKSYVFWKRPLQRLT